MLVFIFDIFFLYKLCIFKMGHSNTDYVCKSIYYIYHNVDHAAGARLTPAGGGRVDRHAGSQEVRLDAVVGGGALAGEGGAHVAVAVRVVGGAHRQHVLPVGGGVDGARALLALVPCGKHDEAVGVEVATLHTVRRVYTKLSMEAVSVV